MFAQLEERVRESTIGGGETGQVGVCGTRWWGWAGGGGGGGLGVRSESGRDCKRAVEKGVALQI